MSDDFYWAIKLQKENKKLHTSANNFIVNLGSVLKDSEIQETTELIEKIKQAIENYRKELDGISNKKKQNK